MAPTYHGSLQRPAIPPQIRLPSDICPPPSGQPACERKGYLSHSVGTACPAPPWPHKPEFNGLPTADPNPQTLSFLREILGGPFRTECPTCKALQSLPGIRDVCVSRPRSSQCGPNVTVSGMYTRLARLGCARFH